MPCSVCIYSDWCYKMPDDMTCKEVFEFADSVETEEDRERWFKQWMQQH